MLHVYAEENNLQWCICQYCVKDVQIVEKVYYKNRSILLIEKFKGTLARKNVNLCQTV